MNIQINWCKWLISSVLMAGLLVGATVLGGCGLGDKSGDSGKGGLSVVATVYPAYDIAKQVGGDKVNVSLLVPPGTEP
ncbi:MAG: zinc ABC transporter substrate-binding protein, partial [Veillonella seminalis]|uniref:metal ABC transporter solute-binding protein, Zn/Mn family n=2 Tax=Veillonella TaxID=29465 RepID=UPI0023F334F5